MKMDPQLKALYLRYKQDTAAVIEWLAEVGTSHDRKSYFLSVRDLQRLVETACSRTRRPPESLKYHFESAIALRRRITGYFKRKETSHNAATETHEFFTQR